MTPQVHSYSSAGNKLWCCVAIHPTRIRVVAVQPQPKTRRHEQKVQTIEEYLHNLHTVNDLLRQAREREQSNDIGY